MSEYFSSSLVAATSAAEPAHDAPVFKYEAATVKVNFNFKIYIADRKATTCI